MCRINNRSMALRPVEKPVGKPALKPTQTKPNLNLTIMVASSVI